MKKFTILFLLLLTGIAFSQRLPSSPREALYQALDIYSLGKYDEAYERFKNLAELYSLEEHHTIFEFMALKSLYKAGHFEMAESGFDKFIKDYPGSSYLGAVYLYLGHIAYRENRFQDAALDYLKAMDFNKSDKPAIIARANFIPMLQNELSTEDLSYLIDNYPSSDVAGEVVYYLGKRYYDDHRYKRAVKIFEKYLDNYASGNHAAEVKQLYSKAQEQAFKKIMVGVLAPITGSYEDYGKEMVNGIKLVFKDNTKIGGKEIELAVMDTKGSPVYATKAIKSMAVEEPAVIIGPLRSECAVGTAIVANFNGIPIITPTASEAGIADLGENVFQVSPPAEVIATRLAEYAVNDLGIREFGIIAPGDYAGRQVATAFRQKVYQLGGEVIYSSFYELGTTDFSNQIKPLREQLLMRTEEQLAIGLIDSSEYFDEENGKWLDQADWRVHLGGLFMPGYPTELGLLVPQIRYHIISAQYFGLDGWDSPALMGEIKRYTNDAIFATDYHPGMKSRMWDKFLTEYRNTYKSEPTRVAALSYDAANLVKRALENGAQTPADFGEFLNAVEDYQGVSCTVNFKTTAHANNAVSIFQIEGDSLSQLK